jgi:dephospho-CoA kinase
VAQRFRQRGAVVIDADLVAREVVALDSTGLSAVRQRFGEAVLAPDGSLDRAALGKIVFADTQARRDLEAITHPLIAARTRSLMESAAPADIVVHEVPLLAELDMAGAYHLTVVVGAGNQTRMTRLTRDRDLTQADARARIEAQASDRERRAAADVWLDNDGTVPELLAQVEALWQDRIVTFNDNLMRGLPSRLPDPPSVVPYDQAWPGAANRLMKRIMLVLGSMELSVEHIGSTSVPALAAKDVIDLQIGVRQLSDADAPEFLRALAGKGFPRSAERFHGSSDPARAVQIHVREHGSAGWEAALLFRDWLTANPNERDAYGHLKLTIAPEHATTAAYGVAKEPWIAGALERARVWAQLTGWTPRS